MSAAILLVDVVGLGFARLEIVNEKFLKLFWCVIFVNVVLGAFGKILVVDVAAAPG